MDLQADVVLPAGGTGERMGLSVPKQFCNIHGRPLMSYTIEAFERIRWVDKIVIVVASSWRTEVEKMLHTFHSKDRILLADAASVRHRSIYSGLIALQNVKTNPQIVVIHDIVRPFVETSIVEEVVKAAQQYGSAGAIRPLISTVVATDNEGFLDHSLDRSKYRASEMPQAFKFDIIKAAYQKCTDYDLDYGTECLHLVNKYMGIKARLVDGPETLWKVTMKKDLHAAKGVLQESKNSVHLHNFQKSKISTHICEILTKMGYQVSEGEIPEDYIYHNHLVNLNNADEAYDKLTTVLSQLYHHKDTFVIGLLSCDNPANIYPTLYKLLQGVLKCYNSCNSCVNILVSQNEIGTQCAEKLLELLASLLKTRNSHLSGQILIS